MINGRMRRPWRPEDKAKFREHCLRNRPWEHSTGPRTEAGKRASKGNGFQVKRQLGSRRDIKARLAPVKQSMKAASALCFRIDKWIASMQPARSGPDHAFDRSEK
jgi:hypothetical protein